MLAPWKKSYDQPRQYFKNRDITLPTKVHLVKSMVLPVVMYGCKSWTIKKAERWTIDAFLNCGVGEDSWESLGLQGHPSSLSQRNSVLNIHRKDWCWSWNSNTLATWSEKLTHLKRPWCWERVKVGGEGDDRGWDVCMASPTQWTWVWVNCRTWCWTVRPGVVLSMGSQRVGHNWATELNWTRFSLVVFFESFCTYIHKEYWSVLFPYDIFIWI